VNQKRDNDLSNEGYRVVSEGVSSHGVLVIMLAHGQRYQYIYDSVLDMEPMVYPIYSSVLDKRSAIYAREVCLSPNYFYEVLAFNVSIAGEYSFWSDSDINTYGSLYVGIFNPFQPVVNRLQEDDDDCFSKQFHFAHRLSLNTEYFLVVTTSNEVETGRFSIISAGPTAVRFVRQGQCNHIHEHTRPQRCECRPIMDSHFEQ
jgi:hypothetical protein